jgi:hypothetical protein
MSDVFAGLPRLRPAEDSLDIALPAPDRGWRFSSLIVVAMVLGFFVGVYVGTWNERMEAATVGAGEWVVDKGTGLVSFHYLPRFPVAK